MYKKGVAVELQFTADRLVRQPENQEVVQAGQEACSVSLTTAEAQALVEGLKTRLAADDISAPFVISLAAMQAPAAADGSDGDALAAAPASAAPETPAAPAVIEFRQWVCVICGWIYDEEAGLPEEGIAPGTRFEDISDDWRCPLCDVGKEDFVVVEF